MWRVGVVLVLCAVAVPVLTASAEPWAGGASSLVKIRPGHVPALKPAIALSAARGECEAAQLATRGAVKGLQITTKGLDGPGKKPLAVTLYREGFLELAHASNRDGATGLWPDPLIPERDAYAGEKRNAFPASSKGSEPVVVYVEICIPADASSGLYKGALQVTAEGKQPLTVPLSVKVRDFTLPATSTLPTAFGFSGLAACVGHGLPREPANNTALTEKYARAALRHRISLYGMTMEPPPFTLKDGVATIDFHDYDEEVAPFLDGKALPSGARFTSTDVRLHPKAKTDDEKVAYWRAFAKHLDEKGWLSRAFVYAKDEPKPEEIPTVRHFADLVHRADKRLPVLVTASENPQLEGAADIFTPNINCLFQRPGAEGYGYCWNLKPLSAYDGVRKKGTKLWWYQSCGSHGCGPVPFTDFTSQRYFTGWPSYMVDHPATLNRAMGALADRFGIQGELYYGTVEAYYSEDDAHPEPPAWESVWRFDGNGDGTLFYPGTPARIGGKTHVPVESLRLKLIRDGLEDYEYLALARRLGLKKEADTAARTLAPQAFEITSDPAVWERTREHLGEAIEAALHRTAEYGEHPPVEP